MKKLVKVFGIVILFLLGMVIASPFLFKGKIVSYVKYEINNNINAKVEFSDVSLSLIRSFPNFSLGLEDLSVVGVDTFEKDTLVQLKNLELKLDLMSVLSGSQIEIEKIILDNPDIRIRVLKNGIANYDITKPDSSESEESNFALNLSKFIINEGNVLYNDKAMGMSMVLKGINSESSAKISGENYIVDTETGIGNTNFSYGGMSYLSKVNTSLKSVIDMNLNKMLFTVSENQILLNNLELQLDGWYQMNEDNSDMDLSFSAPKVALKNILSLIPKAFLSELESVDASGLVKIDGFAKGKLTESAIPGFGLNLNIDKGQLKYPDLPQQVNNLGILLAVNNKTGNPDATIIDLSKFHAEIGEDYIDADMVLKNPVSNPTVNCGLNCNVNLSNLNKAIKTEGIELSGKLLSNIKVKGRVSSIENEAYNQMDASGKFDLSNFIYKLEDNQELNVEQLVLNFTPSQVTLESLKGDMGKSNFDASGRLDNFYGYFFNDEVLEGQMELNSNYLNLNTFLDEDAEDISDPKASDTLELEAFEIPANLDLKLKSKVNTLIYDNMKFENLNGEILVKDQKLILQNVSSNIFGGEVLLNGEYNSKNPNYPFSDMALKVNSLDMEKTYNYMPFMQKLGPTAKNIKGLFSANIDISSSLNKNLEPDYGSLDADGSIELADATLDNLNFIKEISNKLNLNYPEKINLKKLNFGVKIEDGKINIKDTMNIPLGDNILKLTGYSKLDKSINYSGLMNIDSDKLGGGNAVLNGLSSSAIGKGIDLSRVKQLPVLLTITGTANKPKIKFSLKSAQGNVKDALKDVIDSKKEEAKEELDKKKQEAKDKVNAEKEKQKKALLAQAKIQSDQIRSEAYSSAEKVKKEFYAQADQTEKKAKNPIEKRVAVKAADALRKQGDKKADTIKKEGDKKADDVLKKAQDKADAI